MVDSFMTKSKYIHSLNLAEAHCGVSGLLVVLQPCIRTGSTLSSRTAAKKDDPYRGELEFPRREGKFLIKANVAEKACCVVIYNQLWTFLSSFKL